MDTLGSAPSKHGRAASIDTHVAYCKPPDNGWPIYVILGGKVEDDKQGSKYSSEEHAVSVSDLREAGQTFHLNKHGFQLEALDVPRDIVWTDEQQVKDRYYPLAAELIRRVSGATRVHVFDSTVRMSKSRQLHDSGEVHPPGIKDPIARLHADHTIKSGPARLQEVLPDEAQALMRRAFAVIQVWRPLKGPVLGAPLAVLDAQTLQAGDLLPVELHYPHRVGETYAPKYNAAHKFWYVRDMQPSEALVFKSYDSRKDTSRFTPHCSFNHPHTPEDAPPRESIELRAFAFFENTAEAAVAMEL